MTQVDRDELNALKEHRRTLADVLADLAAEPGGRNLPEFARTQEEFNACQQRILELSRKKK